MLMADWRQWFNELLRAVAVVLSLTPIVFIRCEKRSPAYRRIEQRHNVNIPTMSFGGLGCRCSYSRWFVVRRLAALPVCAWVISAVAPLMYVMLDTIRFTHSEVSKAGHKNPESSNSSKMD